MSIYNAFFRIHAAKKFELLVGEITNKRAKLTLTSKHTATASKRTESLAQIELALELIAGVLGLDRTLHASPLSTTLSLKKDLIICG